MIKRQWDQYIGMRFGRLIILHVECHKNFHRIYGRGKNDRVQLNEFISKEEVAYAI